MDLHVESDGPDFARDISGKTEAVVDAAVSGLERDLDRRIVSETEFVTNVFGHRNDRRSGADYALDRVLPVNIHR